MRHTISILLENEAGALSRVAGLFSARGYNIESLTVAPTEDIETEREWHAESKCQWRQQHHYDRATSGKRQRQQGNQQVVEK